MPVSIKKYENKPILIVTLSGSITASDISEVFQLSSNIMGDTNQTFYRITDVRTATSNFIEMLGAIQEASNGQPGSTTDPRIRANFVGTSTWISFTRNALQNPKFGGIDIAAFETVEEALDAIEIQMNLEKRSHTS